MQRYLIQLISDIETSIQHAPPVSEYARQFPFDFDMEDTTAASVPSRSVHLCELFDLHSHAFPPENVLNRSQVIALLKALERLWTAYSVYWDFPLGLSGRKRYTAMTEKIQHHKILYSPDKGAHIDFCEDRKKCPFGDSAACACAEAERLTENAMVEWERLKNKSGVWELDSEDLHPMEDVYKWLDKDTDLPPWFFEEKSVRWEEYSDKSEDLEWLYFYRPNACPEVEIYPHKLNDEADFSDFDWSDSLLQSDDDDDEDDYTRSRRFPDSDLPF